MRPCHRLAIVLLAFSLTVPAQAWAQQAYIDIEQRLGADQLRELGLTGEQLSTLNRMLREADAAAASGPAPAAGATTAAAAATPVPAPRAADPRPDDSSAWIGFNDEPVVSRVRGTVASWEPGTVFALENGQQWKVLKGYATLRQPRESPQIRVVPGVAGRWFLEVDPDMPKARVYRID